MKPIDAIRYGIDKDLLKYNDFTICEIRRVRINVAMGLVLEVRPLDHEGFSPGIEDDSEGTLKRKYITAVCVNRKLTEYEPFIRQRYYALVINVIKDSMSNPVAFLIPKTYMDQFNDKISEEDRKKISVINRDLVEEGK
jgi:hypothetical protein